MDERKVTGIIDDMKKEVTNYVTNTVGIVKLELIEKAGKSTAAIIFGFVMLLFSVIFVLFAFITLGFYLADILGSFWQGFGVSTLGVLLIVLIVLLFKNTIIRSVTNSAIRFLLRKEDEDIKYTTKS